MSTRTIDRIRQVSLLQRYLHHQVSSDYHILRRESGWELFYDEHKSHYQAQQSNGFGQLTTSTSAMLTLYCSYTWLKIHGDVVTNFCHFRVAYSQLFWDCLIVRSCLINEFSQEVVDIADEWCLI
ncbi:hypothetical protein AcW1_009142 [Taiwanofungus camphoratus]|nr:hypothetical protein AcW1_009142 [Antrodia cinnamomea]